MHSTPSMARYDAVWYVVGQQAYLEASGTEGCDVV